jgi:hypothetical protein
LTEHSQLHPYGFPDDWFYRVETGKDSGYGGVRCFPPPDSTILPAERLTDFALFQRLLLSLRDFAHARSAITFIREEVEFDRKYPLSELRRFQCYETTLVVSYCRPFSESSGSIPRLSYGALGIKLSSFVRGLHENLMGKRNKIFAHSDASEIGYVLPTVMHANDQQGLPFTTLMPPKFDEGTILTEAEFEQVSVLINDVANAVMCLIQAMHVNFADRYPSFDLKLR